MWMCLATIWFNCGWRRWRQRRIGPASLHHWRRQAAMAKTSQGRFGWVSQHSGCRRLGVGDCVISQNNNSQTPRKWIRKNESAFNTAIGLAVSHRCPGGTYMLAPSYELFTHSVQRQTLCAQNPSLPLYPTSHWQRHCELALYGGGVCPCHHHAPRTSEKTRLMRRTRGRSQKAYWSLRLHV